MISDKFNSVSGNSSPEAQEQMKDARINTLVKSLPGLLHRRKMGEVLDWLVEYNDLASEKRPENTKLNQLIYGAFLGAGYRSEAHEGDESAQTNKPTMGLYVIGRAMLHLSKGNSMSPKILKDYVLKYQKINDKNYSNPARIRQYLRKNKKKRG